MDRRKFMKTAGVGLAAGAGAVAAPSVARAAKVNWKMVTTWPPGMPILQTGAEKFAKYVKELTNGEMNIQVFAGGELVPPLQAFDAASQGMVDCFNGASYYWAGKHPGTQWFTCVPFGMTFSGYNAWFNQGNGMKLWEELYGKFNLVPRPFTVTGAQMGGWFNKKIEKIEDLQGLKVRWVGLGGKVYGKLGAAVVQLPAGEIYTSLERGVIDATDWVGPFLDKRMGLNKVAKFYYYPGWQEPTAYTDLGMNKKSWDALPAEFKVAVDTACARVLMESAAEFDTQDAKALAELKAEGKIELVRFPDEVLAAFKKTSVEVLEEEADKDPLARKIHDDYKAFMAEWKALAEITQKAYYNIF